MNIIENRLEVNGDNLKNNKNRRKQEMLINIISIIAITVSVIIIIMNITVADGNIRDDGLEENTEDTTTVYSQVAGIDPEDISSGNDDQSITDNNDSTSEAVSENNQTENRESDGTEEENTKKEPEIESKEYNSVTSGRLGQTSHVKSDYFDKTLFLGDSRTVALKNQGFIKAENTFAVNGISHISFLTQEFTDSVTGVTGDIFTIVRERKPERIYVALGVNGIAFIDKNVFIDKYNELISRLMSASPDSIIVIQCILPVNESTYKGANKNLNNSNIDMMNKELLKIAEKKGVFYLDIVDVMKGDDNQLLSAYDSGDGIHFSFTGYSVIYDGICRHGAY